MEMPSDHPKMRYQQEKVVLSYERVRFTSPRGRAIDALEKRAIRKALDAVCRELPSPRVLDLPCGTGRITELLLERGLVVTGGDISLPMIEVAREKLSRFGDRVSLHRMDVEHLDFPDRSFDLVTCIRLFNHIGLAERERALSELARVSRGFVLVNVSFISPSYRPAIQLKRYFGVADAEGTFHLGGDSRPGGDCGPMHSGVLL